jgi:hypothetical protein
VYSDTKPDEYKDDDSDEHATGMRKKRKKSHGTGIGSVVLHLMFVYLLLFCVYELGVCVVTALVLHYIFLVYCPGSAVNFAPVSLRTNDEILS